MFPPMLLYLRIAAPDRSRGGIWLPLLLVWLLLLPLVVLVLVLALVADIVLFVLGQKYHYYTLLLLRAFGLLGATRGMIVHITSDKTNVDMELV
ncbi:MAG: hypothetical protein CVT59_02860 [Actinobacteria bacterium HGW-Actinobacteria-1]|jgi:hypothetical protein|nr:MAG: hypothetical protein CVT59_02860 [Actinobacteria bacterium HGW-Actinobacteria-1]